MVDAIAMLKLIGLLSVGAMFGAAFYIRHLAKRKGLWRDFMYSFTGNIRFYRENWRQVRLPLVVMLSAILLLIWVGWMLRGLVALPGPR